MGSYGSVKESQNLGGGGGRGTESCCAPISGGGGNVMIPVYACDMFLQSV